MFPVMECDNGGSGSGANSDAINSNIANVLYPYAGDISRVGISWDKIITSSYSGYGEEGGERFVSGGHGNHISISGSKINTINNTSGCHLSPSSLLTCATRKTDTTGTCLPNA